MSLKERLYVNSYDPFKPDENSFFKKNQQLTYPVVTPSFIFQFPVRY